MYSDLLSTKVKQQLRSPTALLLIYIHKLRPLPGSGPGRGRGRDRARPGIHLKTGYTQPVYTYNKRSINSQQQQYAKRETGRPWPS